MMSQYEQLGIDAMKGVVRTTFAPCIDNDFPGAWVNIIRDPFHPGEVCTSHMDGDGSKILPRILMYFETRDASVFRGAVDDALSMNLGDIAASGFVNRLILVTDVININRFTVPKEAVMTEIGGRLSELKALYDRYGFTVRFLGGETADLPNQVQSAVFDIGVSATALETDVVSGNVVSGDCIWGFVSNGQASWETEENSGIMSNGLTLAWTKLLWSSYGSKGAYPFLLRKDGSFQGRFFVGDSPACLGGMSVGQALTSPTRQWAILIKILLDKLSERGLRHLLHGIAMNTGGGATKISHLGRGGISYCKAMPEPPGIFQLIQAESEEDWRNMYQAFNCGIGLDIVGDLDMEPILDEVAAETGITLVRLGACHPCRGKNEVELITPYGCFSGY